MDGNPSISDIAAGRMLCTAGPNATPFAPEEWRGGGKKVVCRTAVEGGVQAPAICGLFAGDEL